MPTQTNLLATDQSGSVSQRHGANITQRVSYDPFGYCGMDERFAVCGFNGRLRELGIDRYMLGNGYRVFSTILRRFYSPDSLSPFEEGGINRYSYCKGDPLNRIDTDGHKGVKFWALRFRSKLTSKLNPASSDYLSITFSREKIAPLSISRNERHIIAISSEEAADTVQKARQMIPGGMSPEALKEAAQLDPFTRYSTFRSPKGGPPPLPTRIPSKAHSRPPPEARVNIGNPSTPKRRAEQHYEIINPHRVVRWSKHPPSTTMPSHTSKKIRDNR